MRICADPSEPGCAFCIRVYTHTQNKLVLRKFPRMQKAVRRESAPLLAAVSAAEKVQTQHVSYPALDRM